MAGFRKDKTTAAQTAANVAGNVTAALIAQGDIGNASDAGDAVVEVFEALFEKLGPVVDADNEVFAAVDAETESAPAKSSGGSKRAGKTGGGSKRSSGGGKVSLEDAMSMALKGGSFEGATLAELLDLSPEDAEADYDYGDGERGGRDYIAWLASDKNRNDYTRARAAVVASAEGIDIL